MDGKAVRYLIVGASAAGMAAAQAIREKDAKGSILLLSEETVRPYFRPMIPFLVDRSKENAEILLEGRGPYTAPGIEVRIDTPVAAVDTAARTVRTQSGEKIPFDRLLLATGSRPHIPGDIEGVDGEGVYALRTMTDALHMAKRADGCRRAVMLGGGLLNLKTAFALLTRGIKVTLVVYSPQVLSQLMEPEDAGLIRAALERAGLSIQTGVSATRILCNGEGVQGVCLDDGSEIACQMVCIGKGVRPRADFLAQSGIETDQGIVVDRHTRCNDPAVFAAGDCAVTFDPITGGRMVTGLWTNAVEMGRCAGFNMAGQPTPYTGTFGILNATQIAGEPFVSMGMVHTAGRDHEVHVTATDRGYRKVVFDSEGKRLIGALFIGDIKNAGLYRYLIRERVPVGAIKGALIEQKLHYGHVMKGALAPV